jgi:Fic family protein
VRAGIAHFWFVTLHPFEDGNGRLARAVADLAFAQYDQNAIRFFVMSTSILENRKEYYAILEETQRNGMDITNWLKWFLKTLKQTLVQSLHSIDLTLSKTRFWKKFQNESFLPEQKKILNLLLDDKKNTFVNGISAAQYQKITKLSKATATRHLGDLLLRGCLQVSGSGRSTRYKIIFKELTWDKLKT